MYRELLWFVLAASLCAQPRPKGFGTPATADQIARANLTVFPDGAGLPAGKGDAARGRDIYKEKCASCHNDNGEGREGQYPALKGGRGTLNTPKPVKTVGSYWPYTTTVWDYIRRSMPFDHPRSLSVDEVYSVTAFVLYLNDIVGLNQTLDEKTLPKVTMPNRNGFVPDDRPGAKPQKP